jgi:osmotically-inducible protein OsmY
MALTVDRADAKLRDRVLRQLEFTRDVDAHDIGVRAHNGDVTLIGSVRTYPEKVAAAEAIKRLFGVRRIINDIAVTDRAAVTDAELETAANTALHARAGSPPGVSATVRDGVVVLEGTVSWLYQRFAAEVAVAYLPGVCGVENRIALSTSPPTAALRDEVEQALLRTAGLDWKRITVNVEGGTVKLSGAVFSLIEKEEAERAAWANPGVARVESRLEVTSRRWW